DPGPLLPRALRFGLLRNRVCFEERLTTHCPNRTGVPRSFRRRLRIAACTARDAGINVAPVLGPSLYRERHLDDAPAFRATRLLAGELGGYLHLGFTIRANEFERFGLFLR